MGTVSPKSDIGTPSERYLEKLCKASFLSLWSYPRVYRDQGKKSKTADGKEICDLLVVFGDHVLIFSDKYCEFPNSGNIQTDWSRWYKRAVLKSIDQLKGAERWLKSYPDHVFIDRECSIKLPIALPDPSRMKVHLIAVAHGAAKRCRQYFGEGTGSLMISNSEYDKPFIVDQKAINNRNVHVFDDATLDRVLQTLDTVADFVAYLEKKEAFFSRYTVLAAGEEELLGFYCSRVNDEERHDFIIKEDVDFVWIDQGFWSDYLISPERRAMLSADKNSYYWDWLIENFTHHMVNGTQHYSTHPNEIALFEPALRFMASEPRTRRRMISRKLLDMLSNPSPEPRLASVSMPTQLEEPHYVFLLLDPVGKLSYEEYREFRRGLLHAYCMVTKLRCPDATDVVGIAMERHLAPNSSQDLLYYDARDWTEAERVQNEGSILMEVRQYHERENEYPEFPRYGREANRKGKAHKTPRNAPCPCGSGKKYKHCCIRKSL